MATTTATTTSSSSSAAMAFVPPNDFRLRRLPIPDVSIDWTQTQTSVTLNIQVPAWTRKTHIRVTFSKNAIDVRIAAEKYGDNPYLILQRPLSNSVDQHGCIWALVEDAHVSTLLLELEKDTFSFWPRLFSTDDASQYIIVDDLCIPSIPSPPPSQLIQSPSSNLANTGATTEDGSTSAMTNNKSSVNGHAERTEDDNNEGKTEEKGIEDEEDESNTEHIVSKVVNDMISQASDTGPTTSSQPNGVHTIPNGHPSSITEPRTIIEDVESEEEIEDVHPNGNGKANAEDQGEEVDITSRSRSSSSSTSSIYTNGRIPNNVAPSSNTVESPVYYFIGPERRKVTQEEFLEEFKQHQQDLLNRTSKAGKAANALGSLFHYGMGVEKDDRKAMQLYIKAIEEFHELDAKSIFELGLIYQQGIENRELKSTEVLKNNEDAVKWWKLSAALGSATAMFNLGVMLINGTGCDMEPESAMTWFMKAKEKDSKLQPPALSKQQLEQRMIIAEIVNKERKKLKMSPEEKKKRRDDAVENVKQGVYVMAGAAGIAISAICFRYWLSNRL